MEIHSSKLETHTGFTWANLPFDISHLILDSVEWPTHTVCRQVCHSWRSYFDQPRIVAKRYNSPITPNRIRHRIRELDGTTVTHVFEPPRGEERNLRQIHRILTEPGLAFFLFRDPETRVVNLDSHCFFVAEGRELFRYLMPHNEIDLRGYFPHAVVGSIKKMIINPEYDSDESGNEREEIPEFTRQKIGPWCLKMDYIPFADEPVVPQTSMPIKFEPRFRSLPHHRISDLVHKYLQEHVNKLSTSPTVGELVVGIGKVIAECFQNEIYSELDETGAFVCFRGITNNHDSTPGLLPIEISVETTCEWIEPPWYPAGPKWRIIER